MNVSNFLIGGIFGSVKKRHVSNRVFCISLLQVDLRFPPTGAADPNLVTVIGRPELVDEAIDHLLNLEEEYVSFCACKNIKFFGLQFNPPPCNVFCQMADVVENEAKMAYRRPAASAVDEHRGPSKGFVVREAPWATANEKVCFDTPVCAFYSIKQTFLVT